MGVISLVILIGIFLIIIGALFLLAGQIGVIILLFRLNEVEGDTLYWWAAIFAIIALVLPFIATISWILLYIALGHSIERLSAKLTE